MSTRNSAHDPSLNATGNQTVRGGSTPSPAVRDAMRQADESYVEMEELLEKSGQFIARPFPQ